MRDALRPSRVLAWSLTFALAACGGSSGTVSPDGAAGADVGKAGADGGAAGGDGAAGTGGGAGTLGGTGGTSGLAGVNGGAGCDGGVTGCNTGGPDSATDLKEAGGGDVAATEAGGDVAATEAGGDVATAAGDAATTDVVDLEGGTTGGLCAAIAINAPAATVTNVNTGGAIDASGFTGGTLTTGSYRLTSVTRFGGTYDGTTQELLIVDATAGTVEDAFIANGVSTYRGFQYSSPSAGKLVGTPVCGGTTTLSASYVTSGTGAGATFSVNPTGTNDVKVYTKL